MSNTPDYYATLHVPHDASQQQISRAYRALMRSHHPDMEGGRGPVGGQKGAQKGLEGGAQKTDAVGGASSEAELLRIMQAFAVLRDPVRREAYDRDVKAEPTARAAPASRTGTDIPVRKVRHQAGSSGNTIRITPVRWERGPWA
ncbi:J domain-containing protein [Arthrobacter sp. ZGTC412]|uniref:J domain-containing protein n=1 Tax=Arthrobacter sp. ZGTC412 TaxID=2058900 RepID=UPI000CE4DBAC|nr:J domain-containing protein [Arthrobacter sp. ZGTC412]